MIRDLRIAVIGAGIMGEAMISGMLRQELVEPDQIVATELREERLRLAREPRMAVPEAPTAVIVVTTVITVVAPTPSAAQATAVPPASAVSRRCHDSTLRTPCEFFR